MAGIKISALPAVASALTTDIFPVVQAGVTSQETLLQVRTVFGFDSGTGLLAMANGGTNASLTAALGAIPYSTASAFAFLAPGTSGQFLRSGGAGAPTWSTSTFSTTYAINSILYASAANTVTGLTPALSSVLLSTATSTGVPVWSGAMTNGQLIIGSTGATPAVSTITAGSGISISNGAGSITINSTGGGLATATIAGTTQTAAVNTQYIALNAAQTTVTLPAVCAVGDVVSLVGSTANTGGWILDAPAGDTIRVLTSTTSAGGTVTSTAQAGECIEVVCDVANTSWVVKNFVSTLLTTA